MAKLAEEEPKWPAMYETPLASLATPPACSSALPRKPVTHWTAPVPRLASSTNASLPPPWVRMVPAGKALKSRALVYVPTAVMWSARAATPTSSASSWSTHCIAPAASQRTMKLVPAAALMVVLPKATSPLENAPLVYTSPEGDATDTLRHVAVPAPALPTAQLTAPLEAPSFSMSAEALLVLPAVPVPPRCTAKYPIGAPHT